jgi:flagellar hook assembly protein FlgD
VTLDIYNVAGHRVMTLADEHLEAGAHAVTWNGTGISGQPVASGVYFYRLRTGTIDITKKMLLLR